MADSKKTLQDKFLECLRKEKTGIVLYTMNGVQMRGTVKSYDGFTILIEDKDGKQNLVYKHAISTISPNRFIRLDGGDVDTATSAD